MQEFFMKKSLHKSQEHAILEWLKQGNTITHQKAMSLFDCYNLTSIIGLLRLKDYRITTHQDDKQTYYTLVGKNPRKSPEHAVLEWLEKGKTITSQEAMSSFGCHNLSGLIGILRSYGYRITAHQDRNQTRYTLVGKNP